MKILISSHAFSPSIGGIETVSRLQAEEFVRLGNEVTVVTQTLSQTEEKWPFPVLRRPSLGQLLRAIRRCDVYWQNNLSLRTLWPNLFVRRPIVITHQGSYCRRPSGIDFVQRVKHAAIRRGASIAISEAVARCFAMPSRVIPNPFDAREFSTGETAEERPNELLFVGRLVEEKGVDILLLALEKLRTRQLFPRLTIVGAGPQRARLETEAKARGLSDQVTFLGAQSGAQLAATLRAHRLLVVPSRYAEPFGVVALEGIASGCVVIGSRDGGLPEAIGRCGVTFPNGDANALAEEIAHLLSAPNECGRLLANAPEHLARFHPAVIAEEYLEVFRSLLP